MRARVKASELDAICDSGAGHTTSGIKHIRSVFAEASKAVARELAIHIAPFSPPSFLHYLIASGHGASSRFFTRTSRLVQLAVVGTSKSDTLLTSFRIGRTQFQLEIFILGPKTQTVCKIHKQVSVQLFT